MSKIELIKIVKTLRSMRMTEGQIKTIIKSYDKLGFEGMVSMLGNNNGQRFKEIFFLQMQEVAR